MKKQLVNYAKLHQSAFIPGAGELGTTLNTANISVHKRPLMYLNEKGLQVEYPGCTKALIPYANIVIMHLGEEVDEAQVKSLKSNDKKNSSAAA